MFLSWETLMPQRRCLVDLRVEQQTAMGFGVSTPVQPGRRALRGAKRSAVGWPQAFTMKCKRSAAGL
jgi:hypothetical protein